jgi:hypothetical protein
MRHLLLVVAMGMGLALNFPLSASLAASHGGRVAVVDFYDASTARLGFDFPERFAADDLAASLTAQAAARAAASRTGIGGEGLTVIPRDVVQAAESAMGWREDDVLRFDRLRTLAVALNADLLVIGRIPTLNVQWAGDGPHENVASVVVQVFDALEGRIVAETQQSASTINIGGGDPGELLHRALGSAIPWIMQTLTQATAP